MAQKLSLRVEDKARGGGRKAMTVLFAMSLCFGMGLTMSSAHAQKVPPRPVPGARRTPSPVGKAKPARPESGSVVHIPAGAIMMGSNDGDADEKPVHQVRVASFEMDLTEVTVRAYKVCVDEGACLPRTGSGHDNWSKACNDGKADRDGHPMNCVDWFDADRFCKWARKRLPSEEEWEYAARGSDDRKYPWGNEPPSAQRLNACGPECVTWVKANTELIGSAMYAETDSWPTTSPVGRFPSGDSPFGLHDMAGNVAEWTATRYCAYGRARCSDGRRVNRGGDWYDASAHYVRAARRFKAMHPSSRLDTVGFRCARSLPK